MNSTYYIYCIQKKIFSKQLLIMSLRSVQSLSLVWLFVTPWIAARQASLSITISRSSLMDSDSRPSSPWCHPATSSSVVPFSSCLQSFPAAESFPMSHLFASGSQRIGVSASASVLPMLDFSLYKVISYLLSSFSKRGNRPQVKCTVMRSEMVEPGQLPLFSDS